MRANSGLTTAGRIRARYLFLGVLLAGACLPLEAGESFKDALTKGHVHADLRYRFEFVDEQFFGNNAEASTARLRLGYKTADFHKFWLYAGFNVNVAIGADNFNSTANGKTQFPIVPDPEDEELNQGMLGYTGLGDTNFQLGRQRINLNNQRFVGAVTWRQLEQTFDALSVQTDSTRTLSGFYAYVGQVKKVFGDHNPNPDLARQDLNTNLFQLAVRAKVGVVTPYSYLYENRDLPLTSTQSWGVRFTGDTALSGTVDLKYAGEFAAQSDHADAPARGLVEYYLLQFGARIKRVDVQGAYEVLGSDGTNAFQTPLATLFAFNGWADRFVVTPGTGLRDANISAWGFVSGVKIFGRIHDFRSDNGGRFYGREFDFEASKRFGKTYMLGLRYADYRREDGPADPMNTLPFERDVTKVWLWASLGVGKRP